MMKGPKILVRSLSHSTVTDAHGNQWQYHSRSDSHSKIACWAMMFDLLSNCPLMRNHVEDGKVGFGINHEMRDFRTGRKKNLDLVICTPGGPAEAESFATLARKYGVLLEADEVAALAQLPALSRVPVGSVHLALEAKACMTAHIRALPRLFDELNSSHQAIHGSADFAIAAGFAVVNLAATFVSPDRNRRAADGVAFDVSQHVQPKDTRRTIEKLKEIPRRTQAHESGFDALGIVVIEMKNDGSPVKLVTTDPAPGVADVCHYDQMIRRISSLYANKFSSA